MNVLISRRIEQDIFRIMKHKLKGKNSSVELKCWQMITIAKAINERFGALPYKIKLKHLIWYCDEKLIWHRSEHTVYRYYLVIKAFCICRNKWEHWQRQLESRYTS